jgi:hypothetical protein
MPDTAQTIRIDSRSVRASGVEHRSDSTPLKRRQARSATPVVEDDVEFTRVVLDERREAAALLPLAGSPKRQRAIQRQSSAGASAARANPDCGRHLLHHVAETYVALESRNGNRDGTELLRHGHPRARESKEMGSERSS